MIKSWLVISIVAVLVGFMLTKLNTAEGYRWFNRQRRPQWLTFERLIPLIWTVVFICGAWSAYLTWETAAPKSQPWGLMALYLLLEVAIMVYTPSMFWFRSLRVGTIVGAVGWFIGAILATLVFPVSGMAVVLLIPYLLWSPIGTFVTWTMEGLNRG
jgi:translocator protein